MECIYRSLRRGRNSSHFFPLLNRCLEKKYPEDLPSVAVVLIYLDEALSIIKRALHSIISRTPKHLLKEIIMVDDNSSNGSLLLRIVSVCWWTKVLSE